MVVHIFSGFALFTELMWVYRRVESLCKLLQTSANQNTVHLKLVSFESLAGNDFSERGTQAEATQQRRT